MIAAMEAVSDLLNLASLKPPPSAPAEFTAQGMRFEHHPSGESRGTIILSHPGCPRLSCQYGTRDCYSLDQAVQLILYAYQKDYQHK